MESRSVQIPSTANGVSNGYGRHDKKVQQQPQDRGVSYLHASSGLAALLLFSAPVFAMLFTYLIVELGGDVRALASLYTTHGAAEIFTRAVLAHILGSKVAWSIVGTFAVFQLALMRLLPGKTVHGPVTPHGNVPVYQANGELQFYINILVFAALSYSGILDPSIVYDNFLDIVGALNVSSLVFVGVLCLKGTLHPSSTDNSVSGDILFDYFWGTELYPRILGWDVKLFTNCRFGLIAWSLLPLVYAWKQSTLYGLTDSMVVSVGLQLVYLAKFYHWEMGYMKSLDIMHDRAGFYICWGCLVWVPSVYTSHSLYLVQHPHTLGLPLATIIFIAGLLMIYINYDADRQREYVRNTNGQCTIWGSKPHLIHTKYHTKSGEEKSSILLVSGWWGIARHFHYVPEIAAAFLWSVPALFDSLVPYFYVFMLVLLLIHRSIRDDKRCQEKYKQYWKQYCDKVPYKIVPYLF